VGTGDPSQPRYDGVAAGAATTRRVGNVLALSGTRHGTVRRIAMAALTPRAVEASVEYIQRVGRDVVAAIPPTGAAELREAWAATIPSRVIGHVLGFPERDYEQFYGWTRTFIQFLADSSQGQLPEERVREFNESTGAFDAYVLAQLERRRTSDPPDDAITRMMQASEDGVRLTDEELVSNIIFLLMAGNQTTQNLLTNTIYHLITSDSYGEVRTNRDLVPHAIEESLRVAPPIQYVTRVSDTDLRLSTVIVPANQPMAVSNLSANHDEAVWGDDAGTFDIERKHPVKHLGFAAGPHACFGAALARTVALHSINALMDRFPALALAPGYTWERQDLWTSWGAKRLDVVWQGMA
jgi:cytochrome P450